MLIINLPGNIMEIDIIKFAEAISDNHERTLERKNTPIYHHTSHPTLRSLCTY